MSTPASIGRFAIQRELGRGAMGVVYLAEDPVLGRSLAIKAIRMHADLEAHEVEELRLRFENEARAAARLLHPNLVTIFEAGLEGDNLFIAMEYVRGEALDDILTSDRVLSYQETCDLLSSLASALDYAHARGVVHRDIKPANVLVDRRGQPKITDFGVARQAKSTLTTTGTIIGTPAYMSPEQVTGHEVTGASDQFSLGILAYEMLTGRKPFAGTGATTILYKIVHEEPERPRTIEKSLPAAIDAVVLRAMAKAPADRYPSCVDFALALRAVLGVARRVDHLTSVEAGPRPAAAEPAPVVATSPAPATASPIGRVATIAGAAALVAALAFAGWYFTRSQGDEGVDDTPEANPTAGAAGAAADGGPDSERASGATTFRVESRPAGASVTVDGRRLERRTPVEIEVSRADRHTIVLERPGHRRLAWSFVPDELPDEQRDGGELFFPMRSLGDTRVELPALDAPSPEELPPPEPVRVRGGIEAPNLLQRVEPELPQWAVEQGTATYVLLELVVDRGGRVRDARVMRAVHPTLEELAIAAAMRWRFEPATRDGEAIDAYHNVAVQFRRPELP